MKTIIVLIFILIANFINLISEDLEIIKSNASLNIIKTYGDTIIIAGDNSQIIKSYDNGKNWIEENYFNSGEIIYITSYYNYFVFFNSNGRIALKNKITQKWFDVNDLKITAITVLEYPDGYFIRTLNNIMILNKNFEIINIKDYNSNKFAILVKSLTAYCNNAYSSMSFLDDKLYLFSDTFKIEILDKNLNFLRTHHLSQVELKIGYPSKYFMKIENDGEYNYFIDSASLIRTKDFINFETLDTALRNNNPKSLKYFKIVNNKFYATSGPNDKDSSSLYLLNNPFHYTSLTKIVNKSKYHYRGGEFNYTDYTINKNTFWGVNVDKSIFKYEITNNFLQNVEIISNIKSYTTEFIPSDKIHIVKPKSTTADSSKVLYLIQEDVNGYNDIVFQTKNNMTTFHPTVLNKVGNKFHKYSGSSNAVFLKENHNNDEVLFYGLKAGNASNSVIAPYLVKSSDNLGDFNFYGPNEANWSLFSSELNSISFYYSHKKLTCDNNGFCYAVSNDFSYTKPISYIHKIDSIGNIEFKKIYMDTNQVIDYIHSYDSNKFLFIVKDMKFKTKIIKFTDNYFETSSEIFRFDNNTNIEMKNYYEFEYNGEKYLSFIADFPNNLSAVYLLNLDKKNLNQIFTYKKLDSDYSQFGYEENYSKYITYFNNDTIYLAFNNTIYYRNINDLNLKWEMYNLPNNGIFYKTFMQNEGYFFGAYKDDKNELNFYKLRFNHTSNENKAPIILVYDVYLDSIKKSEIIKEQTVTIKNLSKEQDLEIYGIRSFKNKDIITDLPIVNIQNPLILKPNETYNLKINFNIDKIGTYIDTLLFTSNSSEYDSLLVVSYNVIDSIESSVEHTENIEELNYLYTMPPYPNPTRSDVTAKFYWDSSIDIDNSEIAVYDLNGYKVSGKENLTLEKLNEWSGNIKWNSTGQPSGTYLIKIQHGNNTKSVKVVVN